MVNLRISYEVIVVFAIVSVILLPMAHSQSPSPSPGPSSDGTSIDQGIACVLMLLALVLTYLIH